MTAVDRLMALADAYAEAMRMLDVYADKTRTPQARAALLAALQELTALPSEPVDGWELVPVEPTEEMICAGADAGDGHDWQGAEVVWDAMLAAAPQPAQPDIPEAITFDSCQFWGSNEDGSGPFVFGQHPDGSKFLKSINMKGWTCYGPVSSEGQASQPEGFSPADMMDARKEAREQVQPVAQITSEKLTDWILTWFGPDADEDHCRKAAIALVGCAQPVAQPLTDKQIQKWWASENGLEDCDMAKIDDFTQVVRAVENSHGIGAKE